MILEGKEQTDFFRLIARRGALRLEIHGLKRRGRTAYSICKSEYGLRGDRASVLRQMNDLVEAAHLARFEKSLADASR